MSFSVKETVVLWKPEKGAIDQKKRTDKAVKQQQIQYEMLYFPCMFRFCTLCF